MATPEATFIASIHRLLPREDELHREKMNNPYSSGTADVWYSGARDLWIEYKFIVIPKRSTTLIDLTVGKAPALSVLQQHWLGRRYDEGRNIWVIVGCKEGGVIMKDKDWLSAWPTEQFSTELLGRLALAQQITRFLEHP